MKRKLLLMFVILFTISVNGQTKRALIVAIGDYPTETKWKDLSSVNDYKIIHEMLLNQKFEKENIQSLINSEATSSALDKKFKQLLSVCQKGDMIYFHFSGHGQQVTDTDQKNINSISDNEEDGYDESLVMYDAPKECDSEYDMSDHYIDDRLNYWITKIRKKIVNGHVIIVLDACHSGTASRGNSSEKKVIRGTKAICDNSKSTKFDKSENTGQGFGLDFSKDDKTIGDLIIFSGCKSDEVNMEYNGFGSLSYAFVNGMEKLSHSEANYYDLYGYINEFVETSINHTRGFRQHPQIEPFEGRYLKIFDGHYVPSDLTYNVKSVRDETIIINAGIINSNIKVGDVVEFRLIGLRNGKKIEGKVIEISNFSSVVNVENIEDEDVTTAKEFTNFSKMFECTLPYSFKIVEQKLKINIQVENKKDKREILKIIKNTDYLEFNKNAKYVISDSSDKFVIKLFNDMVIQNMKPTHFTDNYFMDVLSSLVQIESVLKNNLDSEEIDVTFKMGDKKEFVIGENVDLIFENKKDKEMHLYIYEISPLMKLKNLGEFKLHPKETKSVSSKLSELGILGTYYVLVISSDKPINLENLNILAKKTISRGEKNDPQVDWKRYVYKIVEK